MRIIISLCLLLFALSPALADTYEWTDSSGAINFTDNPDKVPAKYRNKVIRRDITPDTPPEEAAKKPPQEPPKVIPPPEVKKQIPDDRQIFCGQSGAAWKSRFSEIREEIAQLENSLPGLQDELQLKHTKLQRSLGILKSPDEPRVKDLEPEDWKMPPKRIYGSPTQNRQEYLATYNKIKEVEQRIQELRQKQITLETEAGRCGVPLHLRK